MRQWLGLRLSQGPLWRQSCAAGLLAAALFAGLSAVAFALYPMAADKVFFLTPLTPDRLAVTGAYWDTRHYATLVMTPQCVAFYPLWPTLIRLLFSPTSEVAATADLVRSSWGLALIGLPLVYAAVRRVSGNAVAALAVLCLYAVNPYALFRVIGYTEALFAIEAALLVLLLQRWQDGRRNAATLAAIALVTGLVALTRPMLPQILAAAPLALLAVTLVRNRFGRGPDKSSALRGLLADKDLLRLVGVMILGAVLGYAVYGAYCLEQTGDALRPFAQQRLWGKTLGLYPWNLLWPFAGHNEFMALYFPALLALVAVWRLACARSKAARGPWRLLPVWLALPLAIEPSIWVGAQAIWLGAQAWRPALRGPAMRDPALRDPAGPALPVPDWAESFPFWFCLFVAGAHSVLILLTDKSLESLARFVFAQPFFFVALATLAPLVPRRWRWFAFGLAFAGSAVLLIGLWGLFSQDEWIG